MPTKQTDEVPKGATTRAAARQEGLAAVAAGPSAPPSMEEKLNKMLACVDCRPSWWPDVGSLLPHVRSGAALGSHQSKPVASRVGVGCSWCAGRLARTRHHVAERAHAVAAHDSAARADNSRHQSVVHLRARADRSTQHGLDLDDRLDRVSTDHAARAADRTGWFQSEPVLFEATDGPSSAAAPERDHPPVTSSRQLICKHETLGSFDGDPTKLEGFLSRVRAIGRKRIAGWEDAVIAAVPDALTVQAAKWHASLTEKETAAWTTLDDLIAAMRRAFPINRAQLRSLARQRQWEPRAESAMNYYYDKVLLMRQAFGDT
ncbi:hypothetical protein OC842_007355, partial [Tilletia horrida]